MTDARLPGRWLTDPRMDNLSDHTIRVFFNSLMYAAEQGTDGLLERRALRYLHPDGFTAQDATELCDAGLWTPVGGGAFQVVDWERTQSTAVQVEARRTQNRVNQQKKRDKAKAGASSPQTPTISSNVSEHVSDDVHADHGGQDRTGKDRPGQVRITTHRGAQQAVLPLADSGRPSAHDDRSSIENLAHTISDVLDRYVSEKQAVHLRDSILRRAAGSVANPHGYVLSAVRNDADRIRHELDEQNDPAHVA